MHTLAVALEDSNGDDVLDIVIDNMVDQDQLLLSTKDGGYEEIPNSTRSIFYLYSN